jgi:hypothetical protein
MMAMLRSFGIEKGRPFQPDERQKNILTEAALVGEAMAKANDFDKRQMELSHYADGVQWHFSLALDPSQESENYTQLDERTAWFYEAQATSKGMVTKTPGVGSVYLGAYKDEEATGSTGQGVSLAYTTQRAGRAVLVIDDLRREHPHADRQ